MGLPHVCKKEICCLNSSVLLTVVNSYLDRHGFCHECKGFVLKAFFKLCHKNLVKRDFKKFERPNIFGRIFQGTPDDIYNNVYDVDCSDSCSSNSESEDEEVVSNGPKINYEINIKSHSGENKSTSALSSGEFEHLIKKLK